MATGRLFGILRQMTGNETGRSHRGTGPLQLQGMRNIYFEVQYELLLHELSDADRVGLPPEYCCGTVKTMIQSNGHPVPDGDFSLGDVPGIRLSHVQGKWTIHYVQHEMRTQ